MNNRFVIVLGILVVALVGFFLLKNSNYKKAQISSNNQKKVQIAATFYPMYFFASQIAGDKADVKNITPAGVEPHDFEPTPQDIVSVQKSSVLVINGAGFEPWVEKVKKDLTSTSVIDASEGIDLQEGQEHEGEENEEEDKEETKDPHVWLSPILAKKQVDNILAGVIKNDSSNESFYKEHAESLKKELDNLDKKYRQLSNCPKKEFVTSHAAFGYLAKEYNLTQVSISGISPEEEPSVQQLATVTKFAKDKDVKYIFFETLVSPKLSETIAKEVGAKTLVLNPIEGLTEDEIKQGASYTSVMEDNLKNLKIALECSP